jgi:hypothetical protein
LLEASDLVELLWHRFDGVLRVLVNGAEGLVLEVSAGFASVGHQEFDQCRHVLYCRLIVTVVPLNGL